MPRIKRIPQGDKVGMATGLIYGGVPSFDTVTTFNMNEAKFRYKTSTVGGIIEVKDILAPELSSGGVDDISNSVSFLYFDGSDPENPLKQRPLSLNSKERRTLVELGALIHLDGVNITDVVTTSTLVTDLAAQIHDRFDVNPFSIYGGNIINPKVGTMTLSKDIGVGQARGRHYEDVTDGWLDPNNPVLASIATIPFAHAVGDGTVFDPSDTVIDPNLWDDGTDTPQTIANPDEATIKRIYAFPDNGFVLMPGQFKYSTFAAAQAAEGGELFIEPEIISTATHVYSIIVHKLATDSDDLAEFELRKKF